MPEAQKIIPFPPTMHSLMEDVQLFVKCKTNMYFGMGGKNAKKFSFIMQIEFAQK